MRIFHCLLLILSFNLFAKIPQGVIDEINLRVKHDMNPSIVVGVFENGESSFYVHGWQHKAKQIPVTTSSIYEIGSISKTYTSLLLATMAEKHDFSINDAIQSHWPKPFKLEDQSTAAITFKHLATHTSGLPRLPANLNLLSKDPYADYGRNEMINAVMKSNPSKAGSNYAYSNFGAGLLGESIAVIGQNSYNNLIDTHILKPLNLTQTYMTLDAVPTDQLAQGYAGSSEANAWNFKALAGAGSIRSSIQDLLAYGTVYLNNDQNSISQAMDLVTQVHHESGGLKIGLGWHFTHSGILWHNGATAGFSSMLMIDTNKQKVVAAITNSHNKHNVEDIALHLMDSSRPMDKHDFPVEISEPELQKYLGHFERKENNQNIQITIQNGQLFFDAKNLMQQPLIYIGEDQFKFNMIKVKLMFNSDENGQITDFTLNGWGEPQTYHKVK